MTTQSTALDALRAIPKALERAVLAGFLIASVAFGGERPSEAGTSEYLMDTWQAEDGLPQNTVTCLTQTRDGYLWLGTLHGLARFDGVRFVVFGAHNTPALKSNRITALLEDGEGTLWIGTEGGGLTRWHQGQFNTFTVWEGLAHDVVQCLWEQPGYGVWIGTLAGLNCWRNNALSKPAVLQGLAAGTVRGVSTRGQPGSWLLAGDVVYSLGADRERPEAKFSVGKGALGLHAGPSGAGWVFGEGLLLGLQSRSNYLTGNRMGAFLVQAVQQSLNGDLWIGTREGGLHRWRAGHWTAIIPSMESQRHPVRCLYQDREGNLWAGTEGGGLLRLKPRRLTTLGLRDGLVNEFILSVTGDGQGGLWIAANCGGVMHWQKGAVQPWDAGGTLRSNLCVQSLLRTRDSSLWMGTSGEGLFRWHQGQITRYSHEQGLPDPIILSLFEDREGRLWIGTYSSGLFLYYGGKFSNFTAKDGFPARIVTSIAQDRDGELWIGSNGMGLYRYANGRFSFYCRREGWGSDFIRSLLVDADGALWIGTGGGGITRMKDGWFHTLSTQQGLGDDVISQMLEDDYGHLWIGANRGIFRFSKKAFEKFAAGQSTTVDAVAYGKSEGLLSLECTSGFQPAACKMDDGTLWFSTVKEVVRIHPAALVGAAAGPAPASRLSNTLPPPIVIEEVWVDGEKILDKFLHAPSSPQGTPGAEQLVVRPGMKRLEIRYTALSFTAPEKLRFKYRLGELDTDWVDAGDSRVARYAKVPPGRYVFRVLACNNDGQWNEQGAALLMSFQPYFWETGWFLAAVFGTVAVLIGAGIRYAERQKLRRAMQRLEQQHAIDKERHRIAQDMHDELGSRLARLSFLSELARSSIERPEEAGRRIDSIAHTSRAVLETLDEIVWAVNPKNDTLEHLAGYIGEYARNFFAMTAIQCDLELPSAISAYPISAEMRHHLFLAVQEALTNIIKHARASRVGVTISLDDSIFQITVEDNGCGFDIQTAPNGNAAAVGTARDGLANMRERLDKLGAGFHLESHPGKGTRITFRLPLTSRPGGDPL